MLAQIGVLKLKLKNPASSVESAVFDGFQQSAEDLTSLPLDRLDRVP